MQPKFFSEVKKKRHRVFRERPLSALEEKLFLDIAERVRDYCCPRIKNSVDDEAFARTLEFYFCRPHSVARIAGVYKNMQRNAKRLLLVQGDES
jgi:hypothetical protein